MNEDFRKRVLTPVLLPLGLFAAIALFAWSLSRVFLTLPATAATFVALLVAGYVLGIGALISRSTEAPSRAIGVGVALGLVGVVGAGTVANAIGPREVHPPGAEAEEEEEAAADEGAEAGETDIPDDAGVFVAIDNEFTEAPTTVPAGTATLALINEGNATHNVHIEDPLDELVVEAPGGSTELGEVELEAGETYSYICSIPGHAETMFGEFTAEDE